MEDKESLFKREEDRQWREKVDHEQVTLMTGHQVLDGRLDEMEDVLKELDDLLRGDRKDQHSGILAQLHRIEIELSRINAVMFVDSTGKKGLLHEVAELKESREDRRLNWGNLTKIIVAALMSGILTHLWPEIRASLFHSKQDSTEHRTRRIRHVSDD